jgi:predicted molibdopterin-dependent oxidoreductase YjgC
MRQAVRNGGAKLAIVNSARIRLVEQSTSFIHVRPGAEEAIVLALAESSNDSIAAQKAGIEVAEIDSLRQLITNTSGDVVFMFGGELSDSAKAVVSRLGSVFNRDGLRLLLHPLPLFNNSIGAHDMGMMERAISPEQILDAIGSQVRALYVAGGFLPQQLADREQTLSKLDFLVVQELFQNETTEYADVVFPAASYAEIDGTFTNNDGFVQRVRQSILPLHQAKPDWIITAQLAAELGVDFGYEMSASAVFREIGEKIPAYAGLRYPLLKDEQNPVQAKHHLVESADMQSSLNSLRELVQELPEQGEKNYERREVGHELFKIGTLTDKVPQFHLLASGNPRPETTRVSPLYQITVDAKLKEAAVS